MDDRITCCIADDSSFFRKFMTSIAEELHLVVLGEFGSGDDLMDAIKSEEVEHPDVIFLDINMPGHTGKELLEELVEITPESVVIMISTVSDIHMVKECLELGASNFIHKNADKRTMKEIILNTLKNNAII